MIHQPKVQCIDEIFVSIIIASKGNENVPIGVGIEWVLIKLFVNKRKIEMMIKKNVDTAFWY